MKKAVIIIFLILLNLMVFVSGNIKADRNSYIIETDNFIIHFTGQKADIADEVADIAEDVHRKLTKFIDHQPQAKTHILIKDSYDIANASANVTYFNRINIYLRRPEIYSGLIGYYRSWLRLLLTHEYAHILQLDIAEGKTKIFRDIFGKIPVVSTPNILQPMWMLEGYTTYAETRYAEGGRGAGDIFPMFLRTAFANDRVYEIDQIYGNYDLESWLPGGSSIYIYGYSIFEYLAEEYGEKKIVEVSKNFSRNPEKGINRVVEDTLGINIDELYENWRQDRERKYSQLQEKMGKEQLSEPRRLTDHGWYTKSMDISADGKIAYQHYGNNFTALRLLDSGKDKHIIQTFNPGGERISWSPSGQKIVYPEMDYVDADNLYYDLYIYDFKENRKQRLTFAQRAYSPVWKDESTIIYITQNKGITTLKELNIDSNQTRELWQGSPDIHISQLSSGPDNYILMSVWQEGKRDIYQYSLANNSLEAVIVDDYINIFPQLSPDGSYIIFSSDRSGIFNLYAYNIHTEKLYQLTDLFTGAFEARFRGEDELVFVGYSQEGFDLYAIDYRQENWRIVDDFSNRKVTDNVLGKSREKADYGNKAGEDYQVSHYNPLHTLLPKYYIPVFSYTHTENDVHLVAGFRTGGFDALENHKYQLKFVYDSHLPYPRLDFNYSYKNHKPSFEMQINIVNNYQRKDYGLLDWRNYRLNFLLPLTRSNFSAVNLLLGADLQEYRVNEQINNNTVLLKAVLNNRFVQGWDQYTNNLNFDIDLKYKHNLFKEDAADSWAVELRGNNRLSYKNQSAFTKEFFLGYSRIKDYTVGNLNYIRTLDSHLQGDKLAAFNFEYGLRLINIKRGRSHYPVFYDSINLYPYWGIAFAEQGNNIKKDSVYGLEVGLKTSQLYGRQTVEYRLGSNNKGEIYFKIGRPF